MLPDTIHKLYSEMTQVSFSTISYVSQVCQCTPNQENTCIITIHNNKMIVVNTLRLKGRETTTTKTVMSMKKLLLGYSFLAIKSLPLQPEMLSN